MVYATNMSEPINIFRPPNVVRRATAERRSGQYRERLLEVSASLFVEHGIARVSVEQLVKKAGVSRATFYGFFANKNELAGAILLPVFDSGSRALTNLNGLPPRQVAEKLVDIYLYLWKEHRNALLLTSSFDGVVFPYIKSKHDAFNAQLEKQLRIVE